MKVLFHHFVPFALAHGGLQAQIIRTCEALQALGTEVEFLRWYDGSQTGDVLHFFGRIPVPLLQLAHQKGMKVVLADLLTEQGSRPRWRLNCQRAVMQFLEKAAPNFSATAFDWPSYRLADACIALTPWEARLMVELFRAAPEKLHVIPNGVEEVFLRSRPTTRGSWLVCTATITGRKRIVELAEAAVLAQTPLWVIGRAYADSDTYAARFKELARQHPQWLRFEGPVGDRARLAGIYREARGFVLLSAMESLSLSALEAAACECPLLLSDLPWARTVFKEHATYCPVGGPAAAAPVLKRFYEAAPGLKPPPKPPAWMDVARQLQGLYESLPKTSR